MLCFVNVTGHEFTEEQLQFVANLNLQDLPRELQIRIKKTTRMGDNSHWCCRNDLDTTVNFTTITKTEMVFMKQSVQVKVGSQSCGFFGTSKCETYDIRYVEQPVYHITTQLIPNHNICEDRMLVCCNHFLMIAKTCMHKDDAKDMVDVLLKLQGAGLLGKKK
ncbi:unnamed protein product [Mytilus edulis]|uniref:Uncharacterized protein n=1 Tax=Mytilus edulis TaxID=6550 RepID=A0A8S3UXM8_MYTED|nr:unnamed protein product [Mytilus edulis]